MSLNGLYCADVPLSNKSLTQGCYSMISCTFIYNSVFTFTVDSAAKTQPTDLVVIFADLYDILIIIWYM